MLPYYLLSLLTWFQNPDTCYTRCGDDTPCLCNCIYEQGQALRADGNYAEAVKYFRVVESLCPDKKAAAIIDSIYQTYRIWVYKDGAYAVATPFGETLSEFEYYNPQPFNKYGIAICENNNGKYFFVDAEGKRLNELPGYEGIVKIDKGTLLVKTTDKDVFISVEKKPTQSIYFESCKQNFSFEEKDSLNVIVKVNHPEEVLKFEAISIFCKDIVRIKKENKWGYIRKNGNVLFEPQFDEVNSFEEDVASVKKGNIWGYIHKSGKVLFEPQFDGCSPFFNGFAKVEKGEYSGCVSVAGKVLLEPKYDNVYKFTEDMAAIKKEGKWGFVNTNGNVISPDFELVNKFNENIAAVKKGGKWGYINKKGHFIIEPQFEEVNGLFENGLACVKKGEKWGYINKEGHFIIEPQFDEAQQFIDGIAIIGITNLMKDSAYVNGVYLPIENLKLSYIDSTGKFIAQPQFDGVNHFKEDVASVKKGNMWGFIKKNGIFLFEPQFEEASDFTDGAALVKKNNKWGWVDHSGKTMIPCRYDAATPFDAEGKAWVYQFGERFRINKEGLMVWEK